MNSSKDPRVDVEDDAQIVASTNEQEQPQPSTASAQAFQPYFVLVRDQSSGDYYHPHVHYIFKDDEPDALMAAIMDGLNQAADEGDDPDDRTLTSSGERYILIDMSSNAETVYGIKSLSAQWHPTSARLSSAPTFDHEASESNTMMTIEGQDIGYSLPVSAHEQRLANVQGINEVDRIAQLTKHVEQLASTYDQELTVVKQLSNGAISS